MPSYLLCMQKNKFDSSDYRIEIRTIGIISSSEYSTVLPFAQKLVPLCSLEDSHHATLPFYIYLSPAFYDAHVVFVGHIHIYCFVVS